MTWNPVWPAWVVIIIGLALVGLCVWGLVRAGSNAGRRSWVVRAIVAVLIALACLRPGIGSQSAQTAQSEVDVLFVVDTTASMVAEDWNGGPRLDGVRADIAELAVAHAGARFALITFDASPTQRLPFTTDATALQSLVDTLRPEVTLYSNGSSITIANKLVARVLRDAAEQEPDRARIVYYFGDGEQTSSKPPESFADAAGNLSGGAVLGYGTASGGPMRETLGGYSSASPDYITTASGETAMSKIDETNLQAIAGQLGVPYELREPGSAVTPAEVDPAKLESEAGNDVETAFELYWIAAIAVFVLLGLDLWTTVRNMRDLRAARGATDDDEHR